MVSYMVFVIQISNEHCEIFKMQLIQESDNGWRFGVDGQPTGLGPSDET